MKFKSKFASAMLKARKELGYTQSEVAEQYLYQFVGIKKLNRDVNCREP